MTMYTVHSVYRHTVVVMRNYTHMQSCAIQFPHYLSPHTTHTHTHTHTQEWLWVIGYFLRARLHFAHRNGFLLEETISFIHSVLSSHAQALRDSPWKGLPELTNKDGSECPDSCPIQAWSMATLLDVLHDLEQYSN